jgi:hypothetical protein
MANRHREACKIVKQGLDPEPSGHILLAEPGVKPTLLGCSLHDDYGLRPNCTVKVWPLDGMVTVMRYVAEESGKGFVARL